MCFVWRNTSLQFCMVEQTHGGVRARPECRISTNTPYIYTTVIFLFASDERTHATHSHTSTLPQRTAGACNSGTVALDPNEPGDDCPPNNKTNCTSSPNGSESVSTFEADRLTAGTGRCLAVPLDVTRGRAVRLYRRTCEPAVLSDSRHRSVSYPVASSSAIRTARSRRLTYK